MKICNHKKRFGWRGLQTAACIAAVFLSFFLIGCEGGPAGDEGAKRLVDCAGFPAASIHVTGLTRFSESLEEPQTIDAFIELRDVYDSKIKAPATLHFDLYTYVPHRLDPRGMHIRSWQDYDLVDPQANHLYWRDYLRSYEFTLEVDPPVSLKVPYLLEVTCWTAEPKRISASYILNED